MTVDTPTTSSTPSGPLFKTSHADEIPSIVIENGTSMTRVGYAGEGLPRHIIPTAYGKDKDGNYSIGDSVHDFSPGKEVYSPMADGIVQDWDAITRNWDYCYNQLLDIPEEETCELPFATTETPWNTIENKNKAAEIAFEHLRVPLFSIIKKPLCTAYNSELPTSLVVDVGAGVASVTPVVEGNIVQKGVMHTRFAGDFITYHIVRMFESKNINVVPSYRVKKKMPLELNQQPDPSVYRTDINPDTDVTSSYHSYEVSRVIDEFKETSSYVSGANLSNGSNMATPARPFEFPDGFNTMLTVERLATVEPLFKPREYHIPGITLPDNSLGISEMVGQCLNKAELGGEVTGVLLNNIIITGGSTLFQGFSVRLRNDLDMLYQQYQAKVRVLQQNSPLAQKCSVWTGASILASLGQFDQSWVTKQEYEEFGADIIEKKFK